MVIYEEGAPFELEGLLSLIHKRLEKQHEILDTLIDYPVQKEFYEDVKFVQDSIHDASVRLEKMKGKWSKE